jgi:hypothetical protein
VAEVAALFETNELDVAAALIEQQVAEARMRKTVRSGPRAAGSSRTRDLPPGRAKVTF